MTTGLLTSRKDANSQTTSYAYDDMLRPASINYPDGGETTFGYTLGFQGEYVTITEKMNNSQSRISYGWVDGVGREGRMAVSNGEPSPWDEKEDICYDGNGRVDFKAYAFQDGGWSGPRSCSITGDSVTYDALGRETSATHSDNSNVLTSYAGRATSVQDEGNGAQRVQRISQVDGLGRLTSVCEVSGNLTVGITGSQSATACDQDIAGTGFLTTYAYDALDNLTSVVQGPLNARTFVYDSLSRLTSSTNPEAGSTAYTYDADGNLLTKKDARSITTTYAYDALNRVTSKVYSDGTPTANYFYDQPSGWNASQINMVGRLSEAWITAGNGQIFSYDPVGRTILNNQYLADTNSYYSIAYTYDLLGDITSSTDGEGVTLTNSYNAGARLTSVTSSLSDSNHPPTLFGYQNVAHYNAAGSLLSVTLGNGINETRTYDARLRLCAIQDGSIYSLAIPSTPAPCPTGSSGYAPNGDVVAANDSVNGNWTYAYDPFNRLASSSQNAGTNTFTYADDRFGNRWNQTVTHGGGPQPAYGFDANNHITGSGVSYDLSGDLTNDGMTTYTYDAEGRITTANNSLSGSSSYVYDAEGRRIRKTTSAGGTVDFLYDLAGREIAQSSAGSWQRGEIYAGDFHVATYYGGTTYFNHTDWLGTERARSNILGSLCESIVSLPYGDAMTTSGSCGDPSPMHFTGKEHDAETGLENFGARYDSSSMGRFMTPDWSLKPSSIPFAQIGDPQTLDLYVYARNNPSSLVDANGHCWTWIQNICNGFVWGVWVKDDKVEQALQEQADRDRAALSNGDLTFGGQRLTQRYLKSLSNKKVEQLTDAYVHALVNGDVGAEIHYSGGAVIFIENHHIFPQAQEFRRYFDAAGIDVDDFKVPVPRDLHRLSPDGVHTGSGSGGDWNQSWREFFQKNPNATREEIMEQGQNMLREFNLTPFTPEDLLEKGGPVD